MTRSPSSCCASPDRLNSPLATPALLAIAEQAGLDILTLAENLDRDALLRSRLTRREVERQLGIVCAALADLESKLGHAMPEIDWSAWTRLDPALRSPGGSARDDALWFAVDSLTPALLLWLRVHRASRPELFAMRC